MIHAAKLFTFFLFVSAVSQAFADPIDLTFEGVIVSTAYNVNNADANDPYIENFYNGGTSSVGTSGTNYGITFSPNTEVICLNTPGIMCSNTSHGGLGNPASQQGAITSLGGNTLSTENIYVNDPIGFINKLSFDYTGPFFPGSVSVYSGINGTGSLLATLSLPTTSINCPAGYYDAEFCPFIPASLSFSGTAESIDFTFTGTLMVFDDITLDSIASSQPPVPTVPEPSTITLMLTAAGIGTTTLRRKIFCSHR